MSVKSHYTVGDVAELFGVPAWRIRRIADSLGGDLPRAGQYRIIDQGALVAIAAELSRQGVVSSPQSEDATACQ